MSKTVDLRIGAKLNYIFDFAPLRNGRGDSDWLDSDTSPQETLSSYTLAAESPGLNVISDALSDSNSSVTVRIEPGSGVIGNTLDLQCRVVSSAGNEDTRTLRVRIMPRNA